MSITFSATAIEERLLDGRSVEVHVPARDAEGLAFNLSNANAADLLRFVGLEAEPVGTEPAEAVLGACLIALGLRGADADPALQATVTRGGPDHPLAGMTMIEGPRAEGYLHERARWLADLAEAARDRGLSISWS